MQIQMPKKTRSHLGCWDVKSESDRLPRVVDVGFLVVLIGCWFTHRRCQKKMFNTGATKRFLIQHDKQHYAVGRSHGEDL